MTEWKECKLEDLGKIVGGATPSTQNEDNYAITGIPWITPKDLAGYQERFISRGERDITEKGLKSCSTQLMPEGTVLFSSRAPIGYIAIAKNSVCTNQGFKSIVPNDSTDSMFLYYLLKYNKEKIDQMGSGTTFKEVSGTTMRNIQVSVPCDKKNQIKIAALLSSLDEKIENNNAINKNLAEQAKALYKQLILDNTDERWTSGVLSDVANIVMGQSPSGDSYNETGLGTVFFQGRAEFGERFPTRRLYTTSPKRMAEKNDVLMSVRAPVGDLNIAIEPCCIGRGLAAIRSKDNHQSFILYTMLSLKNDLNVFNGEGTVFGSINKDSLNSMAVNIPPRTVLDSFEKQVAPIDNMIKTNYLENCKLIDIRDSLLPKLMSGELDVSDLDLGN